MPVKVFKINLAICSDKHMKNLIRSLDFIFLLEIKEGNKRKRGKEIGRKERGRERCQHCPEVNYVS